MDLGIIHFGIHFLMLCSLHISFGQRPLIPAACNSSALYNYGVCQKTCEPPLYYVPGRSHCDNFTDLLTGVFSARCAPEQPCCLLGGVCRPSCRQGQSQLDIPTDCRNTLMAKSCCIPSGETGDRTGQDKDEQCGVVPPQRLGTRHDWPWVVRILLLGSEQGICTGVLLNRDTVLTVAHCVDGFSPEDLQVVVGDADLTITDVDEEILNVRRVEISTNFVRGRRGGDVAVVKMDRPVDLTRAKWPICLPWHSQGVTDDVMSGAGLQMAGLLPDQCFLAGWGLNRDGHGTVNGLLRSAQVRLLNKRACDFEYRQGAVNSRATTLPQDTICTDTSATDVSACSFDDGAMLACRHVSGRFVVVGLVSEFSCGRLPTLFTKIESFADSMRARLTTD